LDPIIIAASVPQEVAAAPISEKTLGAHYDVENRGDFQNARDPSLIRPTTEERATLRKVSDKIPMVSYALCFVEFAERASYYGVRSVFSNFLQFGLPKGGNGAGAPPRGTQKTAGALGKGLQFSSAFVLLFQFLSYVVPILGAWIADTRLGRYKTIAIGVLICGVSHIIMIFGALPSVLQAGNGIAPFLISFFLLAFGAGMIFLQFLPQYISLILTRSFQTQYRSNSH
jgi:dipeptide/tripeptide permease